MASEEFAPTGKKITDISSRFARSKIYRNESGEEFFETYYFSSWSFSPGDNYHTVTAGEEGRLDLISFKYYNTCDLWWVIAEVNDINHPIKDVTAGLTLRIPAFDAIFKVRRL